MHIDNPTSNFLAAAQPLFINASAQKSFSPIDEVIPQRCGIRYFIDRGQSFGLFAKDVAVQLDVPPEKIINANADNSRQFSCATIAMNMPEGAKIKGIWGDKFSIYKNKNTGAYQIGSYCDGKFMMDGAVMNEAEMGRIVVEWCQKFATDNPCKQAAFLKTFSDKPILDQGSPIHAVKAAIDGVTSYWRKTFG